jgi:hypothetical protein
VLARIPAGDHKTDRRPPAGVAIASARPADWKAVEDALGLLARAIQQFQTYPASSPMCLGAIAASQHALAAIETREHVAARVTPCELLVDDVPVGRGGIVGRELAARLHREAIATVTIDRAASSREIARFCEGLVRGSARGPADHTLVDWMLEQGIERVTLELAHRPEVLDVRPISSATSAALAREQKRFDAQMGSGGAVHHLYPPGKGWVRLDPAQAPASVSLLDLAILCDDPGVLASMLLRLTGDGHAVAPAEALQQKYSDVAMVIGALDPSAARHLFGRLARAVLDLDPASRQALLRRTVLPGLLDGRIDGAILRDFPDVELAESLCLLLDLETAAPELLAAALSRLELSPERHASVTPLLDAKLRERETTGGMDGRQSSLARHARELVRLDGAARSFADFAAFDLSMDATTRAQLADIREHLPASDLVGDQLVCVWHLICLEANPDAVARFLDRAFTLLADLEQASRGGELPQWLAGYRAVAHRVRDTRPDVAAAITDRLSAFCTPERVAWLAALSGQHDEGRQAAGAIIEALGPAVAASLAALLEAGLAPGAPRGSTEAARAAGRLLSEHAAALAPSLAALLPGCGPAVCRTLLRALAAAGPGFEDCIAGYVSASDEPTAREALRALARLGTPKASALVAAQIARQDGVLSVAAEETLWHFPLIEAERRTRELLGRLEFTLSHPQATERLLDRAARAGGAGLAPVLQTLAPLRFRIWNPAVARVARKAHRMLQPDL